MRTTFLILPLFFSAAYTICAQEGISISPNSTPPHQSAMLDVQSTSKGLLPPRMSAAQRDAIGSPAAGLRIFNTDTNCENYFNGSNWFELCGICVPPVPTQPSTISGPVTPCQNAVGLVYSVDAEPGVIYTWELPSGWVQTSGGNTASIVVSGGTSSGMVRVTPSTSCGTGPSREISVAPDAVPVAPVPSSIDPTSESISWNWQSSAGATSYSWSEINSFAGATPLGNTTTFNQTGLLCGTPYTIYVWASNDCGMSAPATFNQSTSACCTTGQGGSISTDGLYTLHTFSASGSFTPPSCVSDIEYLVVAGGGGGGGYRGGGGGAGGARSGSMSLSFQAYSVVVGTGGQGAPGGEATVQTGVNGTNSSFNGIVSIGGGGGGAGINAESAGSNGGSGGGEGGSSGANPAGTGTAGQGNNGGAANNDSGAEGRRGGGGGGAGGTGGAGGANAGDGGTGVTIFGITVGGGGGGSVNTLGNGNSGTGGFGGGGNGGVGSAQNGVSGTGGGGGGAGGGFQAPYAGGNGGSGVVVIRYLTL